MRGRANRLRVQDKSLFAPDPVGYGGVGLRNIYAFLC